MPDEKKYTTAIVDALVSAMDYTGTTFDDLIERGVPMEMLHPYMDNSEPGAIEADEDWAARGDFMGDPPPSEHKKNGQYANGHDPAPPKVEPFKTIRASSWHDLPIPQQDFLDHRKLIPMGNTTILTGASGVGKTYVALQGAIASPARSLWLGAPIKPGPVIFYSAEENMDVLHSRVARICLAEGVHLDKLADLHFIDLTEIVNASLIKGDDRTGVTIVTDLYHRLDQTMTAIKPVSTWLDNRGLVVSGNENNRGIAAGAMRACQLLGAKHNSAMVMLSHPSNAGADKGSGASGSTAWFAGGRSVLNLTRPEDADDRSVRTLDNNKTNYAEDGTLLNLKWEMDRFICTDPLPRAGDDIGKADKAQRVFLKLLIWHNKNGIEVSPSTKSHSWAPKIFAGHHDCEKVTPGQFRYAMGHLIDAKKVETRTRGRKDQPVNYLWALVQP